METLNAVGLLKPTSVFTDKRSEPRKIFPLPITSQVKSPNSANFSHNFPRTFHKGLVLFSSVLNTGLARALTYEEALQHLVKPPTSLDSLDFDFGGFVDGIVNFGVENPVVVAGGTAITLVPLVVYQLFVKKPKPWGVQSARNAYAKLGDDGSAQLLDVREPAELRQVGNPDVLGLKKKPVSIPYRGNDTAGFLKKLSLRFKEPQNTTLFILDKFDGNSELVAELATSIRFKAAYAIKDGAEGPRGWLNSGLPWILPKKILGLDFGGLTDAVGEGSDVLPVTLAIAAATGIGLLAFTEVETLLQLLGSAALLQVIGKKLLFAEDRKQTLQQVDEFLTTKVAPKELVDEIKEIGKAVLPATVTSKALPAPTKASPTVTDDMVQKAEAAAEPPPQVNSVPKAEVKANSLPGIPRPLSPYPSYPDLKPPTSPTPSQP